MLLMINDQTADFGRQCPWKSVEDQLRNYMYCTINTVDTILVQGAGCQTAAVPIRRCRSSRRPAVFTDARVSSSHTFSSCSVTVAAFLRWSYNKAAAAYQPDLVDAI